MDKCLLIILLLFLFSCQTEQNEEESIDKSIINDIEDMPIVVKAVKITPTDFTYDLISNGVISAHRKADLKFHNSEIIQAIYVKNGERVVKGQKLAALDSYKLKNNLAQAKDNLERSRLELQDILIGQGYVLRDSTTIPPEVLTIARIRSNYDQSMINYITAENELNHAILYAPFNGIIANLFSKEYNYSNSSETFCTIIDNSNPEVSFNILETELNDVHVKDKVTIYPYAINKLFVDGKITEINPIIDKNGMVRVKATLNASDKLYDGMNVKVLIQRKAEKELIIPKEALVLRNNRKVVFTLKNGQALWNYVETGAENSYGFVVTDYLQSGDSVIYDGNVNLAHESRVILAKDQ